MDHNTEAEIKDYKDSLATGQKGWQALQEALSHKPADVETGAKQVAEYYRSEKGHYEFNANMKAALATPGIRLSTDTALWTLYTTSSINAPLKDHHPVSWCKDAYYYHEGVGAILFSWAYRSEDKNPKEHQAAYSDIIFYQYVGKSD